MFKGSDEAEVGVVHACGWVYEAVVEEGIGASILHEGLEATTVSC